MEEQKWQWAGQIDRQEEQKNDARGDQESRREKEKKP